MERWRGERNQSDGTKLRGRAKLVAQQVSVDLEMGFESRYAIQAPQRFHRFPSLETNCRDSSSSMSRCRVKKARRKEREKGFRAKHKKNITNSCVLRLSYVEFRRKPECREIGRGEKRSEKQSGKSKRKQKQRQQSSRDGINKQKEEPTNAKCKLESRDMEEKGDRCRR